MTLRWGIVSAGNISHDFVNAFNSYPDVGDQVIAAVAARDRNRATEFATLHKITKVFDDYEALAKSEDIDIAYIGVLNPDHYSVTKLFLENGKHVLCEKPLCLNSKQARSLFNIAKKHNRFLMEAYWSRFSPTYQALDREIQSGALGDLKHVDATLGAPIVSVDRLSKKELGGSALLDIGVYPLQFAQFVFKDEPVKVTACGNLNEDGVDISSTIVLEYKGDRRAVLNVDSRAFMWNKGTVAGTKGMVSVGNWINFPEEITHVDGTIEKFPLHASNIPYRFGNSCAGLVYQTLEVAKCIKKGLIESPIMSHKESLILASLEDNIRKQLGVHFDVDDQEFP